MSKTDTIDNQKDLNKEECEFTDLLIKEEYKEEIESVNWTKVKIKNINRYNGFNIARSKSEFNLFHNNKIIYTPSEDPVEVIDDADNVIKKEYNIPNYKFDGYESTKLSGDYYYQSSDLVTVEISDINEEYNIEIPIKPNFDVSNNEIIDILSNRNYIYVRSPMMNSLFSNFEIKTSMGVGDGLSTVYGKKIISVLIKILVMSLPLIVIVSISIFGSIHSINLFLIFIFISVSTMISIFLIRYTENKFDKNRFNSVDYVDDMDKLPESSKININNKENEKKYSKAMVKSYECGDVIIKTNGIKWVFNGENGVPNKDAKKLFKKHSDCFEKGEIPIKYYRNSDNINLNDEKFRDENSEWIMESIDKI